MSSMTVHTVDVVDMMAARERRAVQQAQWLARHGVPLISLTMNIAGPVKCTPRIEEGFRLAVRRVGDQLARHGARTLAHEAHTAFTGPQALWAVDVDAHTLKRWMVAVDGDGAFGRLLDIDVLTTDGEKIPRTAVGSPQRRCLLCDREATDCARSRAHPADALFGEADAILARTLNGLFADAVATMAQRALLREVAVTPKPGLVDRDNSGAHRDMDFYTFIDSAATLHPYLRDCTHTGLTADTPKAAFASLRYRGMCAETAMYAATGGVNTHKGAIFSLGILCCAMGLLHAQGRETTPVRLSEMACQMTRDALRAEIKSLAQPGGARAEAASGFPSVLSIGLPALNARLAAGDALNDAAVYALVQILRTLPDTNVLRRGGPGAAEWARTQAAALLNAFTVEAAAALDHEMTARNISPGGAADLLAVTFFFHEAQNPIELR